MGVYQLFVHIIETRSLQAVDSNNVSDPYVVLRIGPHSNKKRSTEIQYSTVNAVWEKKFLFDDLRLTPAQLETEKDELIGSVELGLSHLLSQPQQRIWRHWLSLTLPESPSECRGRLRCSVQILQQPLPGVTESSTGFLESLLATPVAVSSSAELVNRAPPTQDALDAEDSENADPDSQVDLALDSDPLDHPQQVHLLCVSVFRGRAIFRRSCFAPSSDKPSTAVEEVKEDLGSQGTPLNPFIVVRFNGNTIQTSVVSKSTEPTWNARLELPYLRNQLSSDSIELQLWHHRTALPPVQIAQTVFDFRKLGLARQESRGLFWTNFYSSRQRSPLESSLGHETGATDLEHEYIGSVLLRIASRPAGKGQGAFLNQQPENPPLEPPSKQYTLFAQVFQASELPVSLGRCAVEVSVGSAEQDLQFLPLSVDPEDRDRDESSKVAVEAAAAVQSGSRGFWSSFFGWGISPDPTHGSGGGGDDAARLLEEGDEGLSSSAPQMSASDSTAVVLRSNNHSSSNHGFPIASGNGRGPPFLCSSWNFGRNGNFHWHENLGALTFFAPNDLRQAPDLHLGVYHRAGAWTRKIAVLRIPLTALLSKNAAMAQRPPIFVNGRRLGVSWQVWIPQWRMLLDPYRPSSEGPQAGAAGRPMFLSCNFAFGSTAAFQELLHQIQSRSYRIPSVRPREHHPYFLRCYIFFAANLPTPARMSGAVIVLRYADRTLRIQAQKPNPVLSGAWLGLPVSAPAGSPPSYLELAGTRRTVSSSSVSAPPLHTTKTLENRTEEGDFAPLWYQAVQIGPLWFDRLNSAPALHLMVFGEIPGQPNLLLARGSVRPRLIRNAGDLRMTPDCTCYGLQGMLVDPTSSHYGSPDRFSDPPFPDWQPAPERASGREPSNRPAPKSSFMVGADDRTPYLGAAFQLAPYRFAMEALQPEPDTESEDSNSSTAGSAAAAAADQEKTKGMVDRAERERIQREALRLNCLGFPKNWNLRAPVARPDQVTTLRLDCLGLRGIIEPLWSKLKHPMIELSIPDLSQYRHLILNPDTEAPLSLREVGDETQEAFQRQQLLRKNLSSVVLASCQRSSVPVQITVLPPAGSRRNRPLHPGTEAVVTEITHSSKSMIVARPTSDGRLVARLRCQPRHEFSAIPETNRNRLGGGGMGVWENGFSRTSSLEGEIGGGGGGGGLLSAGDAAASVPGGTIELSTISSITRHDAQNARSGVDQEAVYLQTVLFPLVPLPLLTSNSLELRIRVFEAHPSGSSSGGGGDDGREITFTLDPAVPLPMHSSDDTSAVTPAQWAQEMRHRLKDMQRHAQSPPLSRLIASGSVNLAELRRFVSTSDITAAQLTEGSRKQGDRGSRRGEEEKEEAEMKSFPEPRTNKRRSIMPGRGAPGVVGGVRWGDVEETELDVEDSLTTQFQDRRQEFGFDPSEDHPELSYEDLLEAKTRTDDHLGPFAIEMGDLNRRRNSASLLLELNPNSRVTVAQNPERPSLPRQAIPDIHRVRRTQSLRVEDVLLSEEQNEDGALLPLRMKYVSDLEDLNFDVGQHWRCDSHTVLEIPSDEEEEDGGHEEKGNKSRTRKQRQQQINSKAATAEEKKNTSPPPPQPTTEPKEQPPIGLNHLRAVSLWPGDWIPGADDPGSIGGEDLSGFGDENFDTPAAQEQFRAIFGRKEWPSSGVTAGGLSAPLTVKLYGWRDVLRLEEPWHCERAEEHLMGLLGFTPATPEAEHAALIRESPSGLTHSTSPLLQSSEFSISPLLPPGVYGSPYIARVYLYRGINLIPISSIAPLSLLTSRKHQSLSPYVVVESGRGILQQVSTRDSYIRNSTDPEWYQILEVPFSLPGSTLLKLTVRHRRRRGLDPDRDPVLGSVWVDLEDRLLRRTPVGVVEQLPLRQPSPHGAQRGRLHLGGALAGLVEAQIDLMTEKEARSKRPLPMKRPLSEDYELRLVLWQTRNVVRPEAQGDLVDQVLRVSTIFSGEQTPPKSTDVAWRSRSGGSEWNYRMLWPVHIPSDSPRLKIAVWDRDLLNEGTSIGEALVNLQPLFRRARVSGASITHERPFWVKFSHPSFPQKNLGEVLIELWVVTKAVAARSPVGEAQDEPNHSPFLPDPQRNPPPWALGTRGFAAFYRRRHMIVCLLLLLVAIPLLVPFLLSQAKRAIL